MLLMTKDAFTRLEEIKEYMKNIYTIIKKPLFTEKGSNLKESENKISC